MPVPTELTNTTNAEPAPTVKPKDPGLTIVAFGREDGKYPMGQEEFAEMCRRHYPDTPAMRKTVEVHARTGIKSRAMSLHIDHPLMNGPTPPTTDELSKHFLTEGVAMGVAAAKKAIREWGGDPSEITHMVSTTCTNSSNPGYDKFVLNELGLNQNIERVLLHGVACAGGLAAMRAASSLATGASFLGKPARILVMAVELCSMMIRSELDTTDQTQELHVETCIFSDGASCAILTNNIGEQTRGKGIYKVHGWQHRTVVDTEKELGFRLDVLGWKTTLTPQVPKHAAAAVVTGFADLMKTHGLEDREASSFDWALHPGGRAVITGVEAKMGLEKEHLRASYARYESVGNFSGASIMGVMDRLREKDMGPGKDDIVACAFGPGMSVEMFLLSRERN